MQIENFVKLHLHLPLPFNESYSDEDSIQFRFFFLSKVSMCYEGKETKERKSKLERVSFNNLLIIKREKARSNFHQSL
jgi:hypothetical protein